MSLPQQRYVVAAAILGVHAVVIGLLIRTALHFQRPEAPEPEPLYVRSFSLPSTHPPDAPPSRRRPAPPASAQPAAGGDSTSPFSLTPQPPPPIEWDREAGAAADALVGDIARRDQRKCEDSARPGSWLPKCKKHPSSFQWSEEPRRAGFVNGLPYVRLGRRCILLAGLLGCAVGELPEANGHLFDDLKDPDRDRSSIPDFTGVNEPASTAHPRPQVLIRP